MTGQQAGRRAAGAHRLATSLPARSGGVLRLSSGAATLELRSLSERDAAGVLQGRALVFSGAHAHADSLWLAEADRVEELVLLRNRKAPATYRYALRVVGDGRLRQNEGGRVELLGPRGNAWLRLERPYLVDAAGKRHEARVTLRRHQLTVSFSREGVAYPALLDPGWSTTAKMADARSDFAAVRLNSGKVLVMAGSGYLTSSELYDPATATWTTTAGKMTHGRYNHNAVALASGKVLVTGGVHWVKPGHPEIYDPATDKWTTTPQMTSEHQDHTDTLLPSGKVLVAGGSGTWGSFYITTAELYDPVKNSWTATGSMNFGRREHTATLLPSGKVLVAGGDDATNILFVKTAEIYDPATGKWTATGSMNEDRAEHTATLLPTGKVLVAGGDSTYQNSAELWDPATGKWTLTGTLLGARKEHTGALLSTGLVMVAAGSAKNTLKTTEVWDPATGKWSASGPLVEPRRWHVMTSLKSGLVLIAGGVETNHKDTAELYDPTAGTKCSSSAACLLGSCVDGICCQEKCTAPCMECAVLDGLGKCLFVAAGKPDPNASTPCSGSSVCDGKGTCKKGLGQPCAASAECAGAECVDGSCCASACQSPCHACNLTGKAGSCAVIPAGQPDAVSSAPCKGSHACDGKGTCKLTTGQTCKAASECALGHCADFVCCDASCTATCRSCGLSGSVGKCGFVPAGQQDFSAVIPCGGTGACDGKGTCKKTAVQPCTGASQCGGGHCVDGYCCDTACTGTCFSCGLPGTLGICTLVPAGKPDTHAPTPCSAGSVCDGKGACILAGGQPCSAASQCATGHCVDGTCCASACTEQCKACNVKGKQGQCAFVPRDRPDPDAAKPCSGDQACDGKGTCEKASGQQCTKGEQCASDHCRDGYCCKTDCKATCESCGISGKQGTCSSIAAKSDPDNECIGSDPRCGGACDGKSQCGFPGIGTACGTCRACDGAGGCVSTPPDDPACGVIDCDKLDTSCRDYHDLKANRCGSLGVCKRPNDPGDCVAFSDLCPGSDAGTAPGPGATEEPESGCRVGAAPAGGDGLFLLVILTILALVRRGSGPPT